MATRTLPLEMDFVVYSGATFRREFRWKPDGTTGQDFTGWTATFLIGPQRSRAVVEQTTENGGVDLTDDGLIRIELTSEQTAGLRQPNLFHVLDLIDSHGTVLRFLRGRVTVVRDVERPT